MKQSECLQYQRLRQAQKQKISKVVSDSENSDGYIFRSLGPVIVMTANSVPESCEALARIL